jgi:hypothetical protein
MGGATNEPGATRPGAFICMGCSKTTPEKGKPTPSNPLWLQWALLSAAFASLAAIAKIGLEGVDSDFATLIRTFIILPAIIGFVHYTGKWSDPFALRPRTWLFLTRSGWRPAPHGCAIFAPCKSAMPPRWLRWIN